MSGVKVNQQASNTGRLKKSFVVTKLLWHTKEKHKKPKKKGKSTQQANL